LAGSNQQRVHLLLDRVVLTDTQNVLVVSVGFRAARFRWPGRFCRVYLTEERCGPVNVLGWWDKDDRGVLTCYAVMTNLAASWQTYLIGSRRMWIETMFRDWQSGGFELGKTGISKHDRFARLIILVCVVREHRALAGQARVSDAVGCRSVGCVAAKLVHARGQLAEPPAHL
jgi:hypothetical protein